MHTCMLAAISRHMYAEIISIINNGIKLKGEVGMAGQKGIHDNLPPLVLKARHLSGSAFCWVRFA